MKICVMGLWHLGTVTATCLASSGHQVTALDFDEEIIRNLESGKPPLSEPGLETLLHKVLGTENLKFISRREDIPRDIEILWVAYDTPVDENDVANPDFVTAQIEKVTKNLPDHTTILVSSQMPVGSIRLLEQKTQVSYASKGLSFAYSPENLRLGKAIEVFLNPDRVIVGVRNDRDKEKITRLLKPITPRLEWMSVESAEMTKHAINAFLAISVVFANEMATICEQTGADAKQVERGLKSEQRIGPRAYLSPGSAFAGGTLARDIEYLTAAGRAYCLDIPLLESVKKSNDAHKGWVRQKLQTIFPDLAGLVVTIWGLTYKAGTDTLRRSMAVELGDWLLLQGVKLRVYDPLVKRLPENWTTLAQQFDDTLATLPGTQCLVIGTECPEFRDITANAIISAAGEIVVIDPNRFLVPLANDRRIKYFAVGSSISGISL